MEMTIMIAVAAVLITGISRAAQTFIKAEVDNRNYLIALNLAKQQMAIMNLAAYPGAGTTTPASDGAFPNFAFTQVVSNVATSGANTVNQIRMDVSVNGNVVVRLYTYRTNTVSFGNGT